MDRRYTTWTSEPILRADRAESIATLPPPTTTTFLALLTGVRLPSLYAFMRLIRVRYSLAEYTPFRFSPGIFMNRGSPAPLPMNTASNPSSSNISPISTVRPTMVLNSN